MSSKDNDNNINNGTITVVHRYSRNKEKKNVLSLKKKEKRQKSNKR